ncbi:MAG: carboxypeptidase-like regulatory domain-containing protein [Bacteroidota bacterium]
MKNWSTCLLASVCLLLSLPFALSAGTLFTGKVISEEGEEIIGTNIVIPGTEQGTMSDVNGFFQLEIPDGTEELHVYMGCFHDNRLSWCGQRDGLVILEYDKGRIRSYDVEGRMQCGSQRRTRRAKRWAAEYVPGLLAYKQRRAGIGFRAEMQVPAKHPLNVASVAASFASDVIVENVVLLRRDESRGTKGENSARLLQDTVPKSIRIQGVVVDSTTGNPLVGVTILYGPAAGTVTDFNGQFIGQIPLIQDPIVFSYTGYRNLIIGRPLTDTTLTVQMSPWENWESDQNILRGTGPQRSDQFTGFVEPAELPLLHFTHPNQMLRGQLPGLLVSQPGNDPWDEPHLRQQGIQSFTQRADPIWAVDGIPAVDPLLLDFQAIQNVRLLRRPVDLVPYGLQGGAGVLEVDIDPTAKRKLELTYQGQITAEQAHRLPEVATAEQFRQDPGGIGDYGYATDWLGEVTRTAQSQGHQLQLQGLDGGTTWSVAGSFRDVQGVGRNSTFQQLSGLAQLQQRWWNDRLVIKLRAASQSRTGERDYKTTFFHAAHYNPTAPVFFTEPPTLPFMDLWYQQSSLSLRNYFEATSSLDYFNPVALQAANLLGEERVNNWLSGELNLALSDQLTVELQAAQQANDRVSGEENRTYSFFRGRAISGGVPGAVQRRKLEQRQDWYQVAAVYTPAPKRINLKIEGGYNFQRIRLEDDFASAEGLGTDDFTYEDFERILPVETTLNQSNYNESSRLISFFVKEDLKWNWLELRTALTYQGATRLGENTPWQLFAGIDTRLDLNKLTNFALGFGTDWFFQAGYAQVGNQPRDLTYTRGQFVPGREEFFNPNPDLLPERRRIITAGLGVSTHFGLYGSLDFYESYLSDAIVKIARPEVLSVFNEMGDNLSQLGVRNRSWELTLGYETGQDLKWNTQLRWAHTKSRLLATGETGPSAFFDENDQYNVFGAGPSGFAWPVGLGHLELGAPFGQIVGRQFLEDESIAQNFPIHATPFIGNNLPTPFAGFGVIGNGLPTHTFGWSNQLRWKDWQLDVLVRGELGHDLLNRLRLELEPFMNENTLFPQIRNYWPTEFDLPLNTQGFPQDSDRYLESANYVSLDYVAIAYRWAWKDEKAMTFTLSGQNLALLTNYTGSDPSPRIVDSGPEIDDNLPNLPAREGQLAPGIDRRYFYPRSQAVTFGVRLEL